MGYFGIGFISLYATLAILVTLFEKKDIQKPDIHHVKHIKMDSLSLWLNDMTKNATEPKIRELTSDNDISHDKSNYSTFTRDKNC